MINTYRSKGLMKEDHITKQDFQTFGSPVFIILLWLFSLHHQTIL